MYGAAGEGDGRLICVRPFFFSSSPSFLCLLRLISGANHHSGSLDPEPFERSGLSKAFFFCSNAAYQQPNQPFLVSCVFQSNVVRHHWVHRRRQTGKCRQCGKVALPFSCSEVVGFEQNALKLTESLTYQQGFQQKFTFHSKEIVAISCSWCKQAVSPQPLKTREIILKSLQAGLNCSSGPGPQFAHLYFRRFLH